jgi:hypothetical protein
MRVSLLLCVLLSTLVLTGCRKKTSKEFYKLESEQSILVSRDGDDAYLSAEMDAVLAGLQAIPEDALEKDKANNLVAKLNAERDRVKAEKAALAKPTPPPEDPFAGRTPTPTETPTPAPEETAPAEEVSDAGEPEVTQPVSGMDEKVFVQKFGSCFSAAPEATLPDGRKAHAYELNAKDAKCQKQFGQPDTTVRYLFTDRGLWGKATETLQVRDAGLIVLPVPPQPPPPAPAPPIITTPGAPQPEGYEKVPLQNP